MSEVLMTLDNSDTSITSCYTTKSSDPPPPTATISTLQRIDVDLEDGPLFRATVKEYEGRTLVLKGYLKRILKAATTNLEAKQQVLEQDKLFIQALKEAPFSEPLFCHYLDFTWEKLHEQQERLLNCIQNLLIHPLQKLYDMDIKTVDTKKRQFEDVSKDYYTHLAKYLSIKSTTKKQQQQRTEVEFLAKKREFDLVRFDYYSFLRDLHGGGKKEQEILYHLLNLYEKQYSYFQNVSKTLEPHKQGLDELAIMIAEASREQKMVNQERDEKRRILIQKYSNTPAADDGAAASGADSTVENKRKSVSPLSPTSNSSASFSPILQQQEGLILSPPLLLADDHIATELSSSIGLDINSILEKDNSKFKGIRDLEQQDQNYKNNSERRKEGFLFATSKPIKSHHHHNTPSFDMSSTVNWHKYWCVLSGGQLHEYSNWKRHLETHNEPINLRFATVREARNSDRRFCFEVITPNFRRMYQATSAEELSSWIATINNAIGSLLNGLSSCVDLNDTNGNGVPNSSSSPSMTTTKPITSPTTSNHWKQRNQSRSLSGALSNLAAAKDKYLKKRRHHSSNSDGNRRGNQITSPSLRQTTAVASTIQSQQNSAAETTANSDLLLQLRKQDVSNTLCADCSAKDPDWCSLNLGILICIECSGIHRSLGTHISKVRSLTLDSSLSFTPDIVQLLLAIGNAKSNAVWEAIASNKPSPTDTRDTKLKYIQSKYVDEAFVNHNGSTAKDPMEILYKAIQENDIPQALYAITLGANVNEPFSQEILGDYVIPLLPSTVNNRNSILKLPVLDVAGNEYLDKRTLEVTDPSLNYYVVRYALHFALLQHDIINPTATTILSDDDEEEDEEISLPPRPNGPVNCSNLEAEVEEEEEECFEDSETTSLSDSELVQEEAKRVFPMAEFLFQNGADVSIMDTTGTGRLLADLIGLGELVDDEAIRYLNMKNSLRGQSPIIRSFAIPPPPLPTSSST